MKKIFYIILLSVLLPEFVLATPSISGVSGNLTHESQVTISGNGFGTKNPVFPAKYDPVDGMYPGFSDGNQIPRDNNCPWNANSVCSWPNASGSEAWTPLYNTLDYRGKLRASYSNKGRLDKDGVATVGEYTVPNCNTTGILYLSYWLKPHGALDETWPGGSGSNKLWRIGSDVIGDDVATFVLSSGHYYVYSSNTCLNTVQYFSNYCFNNWNGPTFSSDWSGFNSWHRMETVVDNRGTNHPAVAIFRNNSIVGVGTVPAQNPNVPNICTISLLGADYSNGAPPQPQLDFGEIYVDNTLARVEICNASTKNSSNHCEIQIPKTQWVDGQLQVKINQGSFTDNSAAYLYVVDSTGAVNANGFPVTIGGGGDTIAPAVPGGLTVH